MGLPPVFVIGDVDRFIGNEFPNSTPRTRVIDRRQPPRQKIPNSPGPEPSHKNVSGAIEGTRNAKP
jgi:hypothetical protein